jgi:thioredoxin reductase (NADPH)
MAKPVIFTIDDDEEVLRAIERDLRRGFGKDYRILRASSGAAALEALRQLKLRNEPVALLLSDQRMPGQSGVEFLEAARELFPRARRALLTAYADTDAAIQAINKVRLDHYLLKPWDPPDQRLYPIVQDMLDDWMAEYRPYFEGVRIIGHRWSRHAHEIKDFLSRNQVPYQWLDMESNPEASQLLAQVRAEPIDLPLVVLDDGTPLARPNMAELARRVGLHTQASTRFYDMVIVGAGPAGLAAAVYGASEGLDTLLIERSAPGGQAGQSSAIENYLGFFRPISGSELTRRALEQAKKFKAEVIVPQEVVGLRHNASLNIVTLADGSEIGCYAVLIATGVSYRKLAVPGIDRLTGAGVYYGAAITEAISCRGADVFIVGAGNSAGQAAMHLAGYANKVNILVRGPSISASMSQYLVDQIKDTGNIEVHTCTEVAAVHGENNVEAVTIRDSNTGHEQTWPASALFIFIGAVPHTDWVAGAVERDEHGFIVSGADLVKDGKPPRGWPLERLPYWLETSVPGIFVAGDVRQNSVKRVASAVGEGAMAVVFIHKHLASLGASV